jgi:energy-coupling factor transporter ATP-binding protein EcfA2
LAEHLPYLAISPFSPKVYDFNMGECMLLVSPDGSGKTSTGKFLTKLVPNFVWEQTITPAYLEGIFNGTSQALEKWDKSTVFINEAGNLFGQNNEALRRVIRAIADEGIVAKGSIFAKVVVSKTFGSLDTALIVNTAELQILKRQDISRYLFYAWKPTLKEIEKVEKHFVNLDFTKECKSPIIYAYLIKELNDKLSKFKYLTSLINKEFEEKLIDKFSEVYRKESGSDNLLPEHYGINRAIKFAKKRMISSACLNIGKRDDFVVDKEDFDSGVELLKFYVKGFVKNAQEDFKDIGKIRITPVKIVKAYEMMKCGKTLE